MVIFQDFPGQYWRQNENATLIKQTFYISLNFSHVVYVMSHHHRDKAGRITHFYAISGGDL